MTNAGDESAADPESLLLGIPSIGVSVLPEPAPSDARDPRQPAAPAWAVQFGRYLLVGGASFLVDFSVMVALAERAGVGYLYAASAGFLCGLVMNYVLSVTWVFDARSVNHRGFEFLVFTAIGLCGLGLNELLMMIGVERWGVDYRLVKIFVVASLLIWNFAMRKLLLFSKVPA